MKFILTALGFLAIASPVIGDTADTTSPACTADQVIVSLTTNDHFADEMQSYVDKSDSNIDPSGKVFKNFKTLLGRFNDDVKCTVNANQDEQAQICGAFVTFAKSQLRYLHVADGLKFYQANGHGENESKMRGYIQQYKAGLEGYKNRIKAAVPSCVDQIDIAYTPLSEQFNTLLQEYPAVGPSGTPAGPPAGNQAGNRPGNQ
ncbi:hypothetical protein N7456_001038 [Penicillium angulare]|uniref:Uncharacterized protein n=1 Tax=Penicillium angulare TaxID=116970 RepID=A0A9W9KSN8_9EURO|nr:hypothetical protein N7456_001038 [Penicillium angulare]